MQVLFVTNETIGQKRSGPAVRCLELAKALARQHEVTIASTQACDVVQENVSILPQAIRRQNELRTAAKNSAVVITQGLALAQYPSLSRLAQHLVIDLYDPYLLEYLAHPHPQHPRWGYLRQWYRLNQQMLRGDFFLCANQRQWDYWLGRLCALGRLTTEEYQRDSCFRGLLAVVPFGLPSAPPVKTKNVIKGVIPGIQPNDIVLLWAGGIWQWLDPLTVIRAVAECAKLRPDIKLLFMGTRDPNPNNRSMPMLEASRKLAVDLGVLDGCVFFYEDWVPYGERQNFLLEADAGVSAHPESVESRFAFRTRALDYLWAGVPMLLTAGDHFADFAVRENVGWALPPGDVAAWKQAILLLASNPEARQQMRARLQALAPKFYWEAVAAPLMNYCDRPYRTQRISAFQKILTPTLSLGFEFARRLRR